MVDDLSFQNKNIKEINEKILDLNLQIVDNSERILKNYEKKTKFDNEPLELYFYNHKKFVHFKHEKPPFIKEMEKNGEDFHPHPPFRENYLLMDIQSENKFKYFWMMALIFIDILLIWFYLFIRNKLTPLKELKEHMIQLSKGDFSVSCESNGKDEISQVSNEFNNAIKQLKILRESRNLFLRNIMHELKTPITKGRLVTDLIENDQRKERLKKIFLRLEYLLGEFSKIEEFTSGHLKLKKDEYRVIDLIDQALDILLLDSSVCDIESKSELTFIVDFELFSIALKNLIDNAIKYSSNGKPKIVVGLNSIMIINSGKKLTKGIEEYFKPFNHDYESSQHGLGLGLYITNSIIKSHNYNLYYSYENEQHIFEITKF